MNDNFSAIIFKTRGLFLFIAPIVSIPLKFYLHGKTSLELFLIGLAIMIIFEIFRIYSASYMLGKHAVMEVKADFLCTSGPYAYIRNPLYLGNFIIGIGVCIAINEWYAFAIFIASYGFIYYFIIPHEEKFLQEKFGDVYAEYKSHTGRLLPKMLCSFQEHPSYDTTTKNGGIRRMRGYKGKDKIIPNFKDGFFGEIHVPIVLTILFVIIYVLFVK